LHLLQPLLKLLVLRLELIEMGRQARQSALQFVQATFYAALGSRSTRQHKDRQERDAK